VEIRDRIRELRRVPAAELRAHPKNWRIHTPAQRKALAAMLEEVGYGAAAIAYESPQHGPGLTLIDGHLRQEQAADGTVPVLVLDVTDEEAEKLLATIDPLSAMATPDLPKLDALVGGLEFKSPTTAQIMEDVAGIYRAGFGTASGGTGQESAAAPVVRLSERFVVPPFSVLDGRAGYWQERKRAWLCLGLRSEVGRGENLLGFSDTVLTAGRGSKPGTKAGSVHNDPQFYRKKRAAERAITRGAPGLGLWKDPGTGASANDPSYFVQKQAAEAALGRELTSAEFAEHYYDPGDSFRGTSVFDPVLCELAYRWFSPPGGRVLDPFAGGSVRGIVAACLGREYVGIELREEQVRANEAQREEILSGAPPPQLATLCDPEQLTPVQALPGRRWIKRDDLFECNGSRGSKARAALAILTGAKGCTTAGSRHSPMGARVARVAEHLGIPCRVHYASSKELSPEELDAQTHGAELVKHSVNYLTALRSKAREDAKRRGWVFVELGVESAEFVDLSRKQVANCPPEAERVVIPVGTGMALAALLHGLDDYGRSELPVLGVVVGMQPEKWLKRWAPANWQSRVELVKAASPFSEPAEDRYLCGVLVDAHYEAKCLPFMREGDVLWSVALSAHEAEGGA
jgi:1-aminocyclopropane-1-carboxylate deaminase/D-cysteine desulfhydrase-like pyridoxal-dependent ACC family enzyme